MTNTEYTALKAEIDLTTTNEGLAKLRTQIGARRLRSKERKLLRRINLKSAQQHKTERDRNDLKQIMAEMARGMQVPLSFLGYPPE